MFTLSGEEKWQPTPGFLPGKSHRQRNLAGYSPWGSKESDTAEPLNNNNKLKNDQDIYLHFPILKDACN